MNREHFVVAGGQRNSAADDDGLMMADACVQQHPPYCYYVLRRRHHHHYRRVLLVFVVVVVLLFGVCPPPVASSFAANNCNNPSRRKRGVGADRSSSSSSSSTPTTTQQSAWWIAELQKCRTADETIERICKQLPRHEFPQPSQQHDHHRGNVAAGAAEPTSSSSFSSLYSLILIRLSRQLLLSSATVVGRSGGGGDDEQNESRHYHQQVLPEDSCTTSRIDVDAIRQIVIGLTTTARMQLQEEEQATPVSSSASHNDSRRTEQCLTDCVEGTKAAAIIARSLSMYFFFVDHDQRHNDDRESINPGIQLGVPLREFWRSVLSSSTAKDNNRCHQDMVSLLTPPAMTGLKWAMDTFRVLPVLGKRAEDDGRCLHSNLIGYDGYDLPLAFRTAYDRLRIPFAVVPNGLALPPPSPPPPHGAPDTIWTALTIPSLVTEVDFRADTIQTTATQRTVRERRYTAWQGDPGVAAFAYSGKCMARADFTASVRAVRDRLYQPPQSVTTTGVGPQYYDGCLLNYYPNGESAMRYHRDPDQGTLWDYDTAVVSIGSPRPFSFRRKRCWRVGDGNHIPTLPEENKEVEEIHNFVVFHGDVTHMFADCQTRFEHTVKKACVPDSPRISLVFKRSFRSIDRSKMYSTVTV